MRHEIRDVRNEMREKNIFRPSFQFSYLISHISHLLVIACVCILLLPSTVYAANPTCAQVAEKFSIPAACTASCSTTDVNLSNVFMNISGIDSTALCPNMQSCCAKSGHSLCEGMTSSLNLQGVCRASVCSSAVNSVETPFLLEGQNTCGSAGTCCVVGKATITAQNLAALLSSAGATGKSASTTAPSGATQALYDPLGGVNIPTLIGNIVRTFTGIAGSLALLMFVYGGVMYILSGGEKASVEKSKTILVNASIGIVLIFLAYLLTSTIINAMLAT